MSLTSFKAQLLVQLREQQQNAVADILRQISASAYRYDTVAFQSIQSSMSPLGLSLMAAQIVQSTEALIGSLAEKVTVELPEYERILNKIRQNRSIGTTDLLQDKSVADLDERELLRLFQQKRTILGLDNVVRLLIQNKTRAAIDLLLASTTGDVHTKSILLLPRLVALEQDRDGGTLTSEAYDVKRAVLHRDIMEMVELFEEKELSTKEETAPQNNFGGEHNETNINGDGNINISNVNGGSNINININKGGENPNPPNNPNKSPLKILMLTANHGGRLDINTEYAGILDELQEKQHQFLFNRQTGVSKGGFKKETEKFKPIILHFSGHGNGAALEMIDDEGRTEVIPTEGLKVLFSYFKNVKRIAIQTVILNACFSEEQAEAIAPYVVYVVGTTIDIGDKCAIAFSQGFYFELADNQENIEGSYLSGVTHACLEGAKQEHFVIYKEGKKLPITI